jgi:heme/copper-type cytochrome/quinol oxidase subunit 2
LGKGLISTPVMPCNKDTVSRKKENKQVETQAQQVVSSMMIIIIIIVVVIVVVVINVVSCHRPFLRGTSLETAVIPTAQASSFTLQYFPYYV